MGEVFPTAELLEVLPYDDFINNVLNVEKDKSKKINKKTPDEIMQEFLPIIKKDKGG